MKSTNALLVLALVLGIAATSGPARAEGDCKTLYAANNATVCGTTYAKYNDASIPATTSYARNQGDRRSTAPISASAAITTTPPAPRAAGR